MAEDPPPLPDGLHAPLLAGAGTQAGAAASKRKRRKSKAAGAKGNQKGKRKLWMRLRNRADASPPPVDVTFQFMQMRKTLRKIHGTYETDRPWTMLWVFLTLLLVFGVAGANFVGGHFEFKVSTGQLGFVSLVTVLSFLILVYTLTRVIVVFRWMLYWLLSAEALNLALHKEYNLFSDKTPSWLLIMLTVAEVLTLLIYLFVQYLYPSLLGSEWFRRNIGPENYWEVRAIGPWTLTYATGFSNRSTCSYRGQTNAAGLPHGYGHWMDDSYHGEILTGWWENGKPVGPFRSREYGSGYAFDNLMIGFVMATDDEFSTFKYLPTNDRAPRCGVASVECSVTGGFFSHLPSAKVLFGPHPMAEARNDPCPTNAAAAAALGVDLEAAAGNAISANIKDCLSRLRYLSTAHPLSSVLITANAGKGVSVAGHIYNPNGKFSSRSCRQLVIDVVYPNDTRAGAPPRGAAAASAADSRRPAAPEPTLQVSSGSSATLDTLSMNESDCAESSDSPTRGGTGRADSFSCPSDEEEEEEDDDDEDDDDDDDDDDDEGDNEAAMRLTPALRSSMRFAENDAATGPRPEILPFGLSDDGAGVAAAASDRRPTVDSDLDSVDYDSGTFGLGSYAADHWADAASSSTAAANGGAANGGAANGTRRALPRSMEHESMLLDASLASSMFEDMGCNSQSVANASAVPHLQVRGWRSTIQGHAEALIFIPGFNCSVQHSLERFGQFLAMGHFPPHIKPFLFSWPAGKVATYLKAVNAAASERTADMFGFLLDGLYDAGIRDVHIMTHSMGVQMLLGAFRDRPNGGRSHVSLRFSLAPDFAAASRTFESVGDIDDLAEGANEQRLLRCRTISLLNPDFPLAAFVDHSFATIRRVCEHITIIGNDKDQALFWSEVGNGAMNTLHAYFGGSSNPAHLRVPRADPHGDPEHRFSHPRDPDSCCPSSCVCCFRASDESAEKAHGRDRLFSMALTVGKNIFSLYAAADPREDEAQHVFQGAPSFLTSIRREARTRRRNKRRHRALRRAWLDLDAIDTTWMEANVHALRHNYFNLNPVLIEDLQELIVTGRRAAERSTLLHREGNIYSYCQAPACVVNED